MNSFKLYFKNDIGNYFSLTFECYNYPIAIKWFNCLVEQQKRNPYIAEPDRLYNFLNSESEEDLVSNLNECIASINSESLLIPHTANINMSQDNLNLLHLYFEKLRGGILSESNYWKNATPEQQKVLEKYNILIHKTENFYRNRNSSSLKPRIVCTFKPKKRQLLDEDDYSHFTLVRKFGEVYINYCEVGKPLHDVFKDNDEIVGHENIRPLKWFSPDFTVFFHNLPQRRVDIFIKKMNHWWDLNKEKLQRLGFSKNDPKNAIGNIPVAKLKTLQNSSTILKNINDYYSLSHIETIQN